MTLPRIASVPGGASLAVRLQPRSSRSGVRGLRDGALLLAVNSPPVEGRANEALVEWLSAQFGASRDGVLIIAGRQSRRKMVRVLNPTETPPWFHG